MSLPVRTKLDELLKTTSDTDNLEESEETENTAPHNTPSPLAILKSDLGRIGLDRLISEAAKLEQLRQLELPDNLFGGMSNIGSRERCYDESENVPTDGIIGASLSELILETKEDGSVKINRINYELAVL